MASWRSRTKIARSGSVSIDRRHGSTDPDPYQNVTDPQHWLQHSVSAKKNGAFTTGNAMSYFARLQFAKKEEKKCNCTKLIRSVNNGLDFLSSDLSNGTVDVICTKQCWIWIRIRHFKWIKFRIHCYDDQKWKKYSSNIFHLFLIKDYTLLIPRPP